MFRTKTTNRWWRLLALAVTAVVLLQTRFETRVRQLREDDDRGDIPGWAIAAGASVVLGLLVWAAVQGVVGNYINKINSGSK